MTTIEEKVLEEIKHRGIKPRAKWVFVAKNASLWAMFSFSLVALSIALGVTLFLATNTDFEILEDLDADIVQKTLHMVPVAWIALSLFFAVFAYANLFHTKTGYRRDTRLFKSVIAGAIAILAIGMAATDIAEKVENKAAHIPYYSATTPSKNVLWSDPENGRISGTILEIKNNQLTLEDPSGADWKVRLSPTTYDNDMQFILGERVKVVGKQKGANNFEAIEIRPW